MNEELDKAFGFLIHDISTLLRTKFNQLAKDAGLTMEQWLIISNLSRNDNITQKELAKLADLTPLALTRQLDVLEARKWVKRKDDRRDRRSKIVRLTNKAEELMEIYDRARLEARAQALAGLQPEQVESLSALLIAVRQNLRQP